MMEGFILFLFYLTSSDGLQFARTFDSAEVEKIERRNYKFYN